MFRRCFVGMGLILGLSTGCSESYQLPDRNAPAVQAEERRLAALLPSRLLWGPGTCKVRLLGTEGSTSFAWAVCEVTPGGGVSSGGVSVPVRVDGDRVTKPADGEGYSESVKRVFPPCLADLVIHKPDRVRP